MYIVKSQLLNWCLLDLLQGGLSGHVPEWVYTKMALTKTANNFQYVQGGQRQGPKRPTATSKMANGLKRCRNKVKTEIMLMDYVIHRQVCNVTEIRACAARLHQECFYPLLLSAKAQGILDH